MMISHVENIQISRKNPLLILEAGVNHECSLVSALDMVDAAAEAGAHVIKFQSYKATTLASINSPAYWDQAKEPANSQFELFKQYDHFEMDDYQELSDHCKGKGIIFTSTAFDLRFVEELNPLMPLHKVASADITNFPLLKLVASKHKPILLSVGASYLPEIQNALSLLKENGAGDIALMHCILEYPTKPENANLSIISSLKNEFPGHTIGWSDHIPPDKNCSALLAAWLLGADILEKHFTLDKTKEGNDHYHAMDPDDVRNFLAIQKETALLLGSPEKTVLPCEEEARKYARRSIVAAADIPAGTILVQEMFTEKRPGTGIPPNEYDRLLGHKAPVNFRTDDVIDPTLFPRKEAK